MRHGSLFSGIGGFDLAAEWMGWENKFHCEWNEFGQKILQHYWPKAKSYYDITKTDFTIWRGKIDIITGGFPCQPYSVAGKRKGKEDERHLWPEMLRCIREIQPSYVVGENVYGLINWSGGLVFDEVQSDLEAEGYEVIPVILPASGVNAPHKRDRIWFIAYRTNSRAESLRRERENTIYGFKTTTDTGCNGHELRGFGQNRQTQGKSKIIQKERKRIWNDHRRNGTKKTFTNSNSFGLQGRNIKYRICKKTGKEQTKISCSNTWENFPTQPPICGGNDGIPTRLDGITFPKWRNESIKGFGNAIVPKVAYEICKVINEIQQL